MHREQFSRGYYILTKNMSIRWTIKRTKSCESYRTFKWNLLNYSTKITFITRCMRSSVSINNKLHYRIIVSEFPTYGPVNLQLNTESFTVIKHLTSRMYIYDTFTNRTSSRRNHPALFLRIRALSHSGLISHQLLMVKRGLDKRRRVHRSWKG